MRLTARYVRIATTLLALAAFAIAANALPPLVTTLAGAYGIPIERFGFAFFFQYISFAAASTVIAAGTRGRFGALILVSSLLLSALLFLAAPILTTFTAILIWFIPLGFSGGLTETQATILLGREDGDGSSRIVSLSQAFFCLGAIVAPQLVAALLERGIRWERGFYVISGLIGLVTMAAFVVFVKTRTTDTSAETGKTMHVGANAAFGADAGTGEARPAKPHDESDPGIAPGDRSETDSRGTAPARSRLSWHLIAFAAAMFFYVFAEGSIVAWSSAFFEIERGFAPAPAARMLGAFWFGVLIGRVVVFFLPRRLSVWPALLVGSALGSMLVGVLAFAPIGDDRIFAVILVVSGALLGPIWPVLVSTGRSVLRSESAVATIVTAGALGVAIGPFVSSRVIAILGMGHLFVFVFACSVVVTGIVYTVRVRAG